MHIPYSLLSKQTIISYNFQNSKGTKQNAVFFYFLHISTNLVESIDLSSLFYKSWI